tara:strand:- start:8147 stop:8500 length:354 start_codon:yes stop_codon:yes gene_type:complete
MHRLFSLLILCTFLSISYSEVIDVHIAESHLNNALEQVSLDIPMVFELTVCDDCEDDCSEEGNCCQVICSAHATMLYSFYSLIKNDTTGFNVEKHWYYFNSYLSRYIEPDLRPPFFS